MTSPDDPPPPADPGPRGPDPDQPGSRIDPELAFQLEGGLRGRYRVEVWFRVLPSPSELVALGLPGTESNPVAGLLDADQIHRIAERPETDRVVLRPQPHLF